MNSMHGVLHSLEGSLGCFFSCPALALSVALWPIQPVAESLQLAMEDPFGADASRPPYAKTPRTPAFEMADLVVPLMGVQVGGGYLSLSHILYLQYIHKRSRDTLRADGKRHHLSSVGVLQ
jgi:hypothetical protein